MDVLVRFDQRPMTVDDGAAHITAVWFRPDYGSTTPLWDVRSGAAVPPGRLGLSRSLARDLEAWCRRYDEVYRWDTGWISVEARADHVRTGRALVEDVRREAAGRFTVVERFGPGRDGTGGPP